MTIETCPTTGEDYALPMDGDPSRVCPNCGLRVNQHPRMDLAQIEPREGGDRLAA